jgi:polar amino acid transport system substrate-binding protein
MTVRREGIGGRHMLRWRRILGVLAGLAAAACRAAGPAPIPVTVYADAGYPPYSFVEAGEAVGIYADIMRRAFARMPNYVVTIIPVPWKRGLALLEQGQAVALYPPYRRSQERPWMTPYSEPVLEETVVVICRDEILAKPRPRWPDDYAGLVIGSNSGFLGMGERFRAAVKQGALTYDDAGTSQQNIQKLVSGRIDCYVNDRRAILWAYHRQQDERKVMPGDHPGILVEGAVISKEYGYLGFTSKDEGRFPFKQDFLKEFNTVICSMRASGEIGRIAAEYFRP